MVKGVPSERDGTLFFIGGQCLHFAHAKGAKAQKYKILASLAPWREKKSFHPGGRGFRLTPANHPRKEDIYMAKSKSSTAKPISIRYTCAPNGDQVGLSHYLMADAKKAR